MADLETEVYKALHQIKASFLIDSNSTISFDSFIPDCILLELFEYALSSEEKPFALYFIECWLSKNGTIRAKFTLVKFLKEFKVVYFAGSLGKPSRSLFSIDILFEGLYEVEAYFEFLDIWKEYFKPLTEKAREDIKALGLIPPECDYILASRTYPPQAAFSFCINESEGRVFGILSSPEGNIHLGYVCLEGKRKLPEVSSSLPDQVISTLLLSKNLKSDVQLATLRVSSLMEESRWKDLKDFIDFLIVKNF
jgi:hypothetical protein